MTFAIAFTLSSSSGIAPLQIRFRQGEWIDVPEEKFVLPKLPIKQIKPFNVPNLTMPNLNIPTMPQFKAPPIPSMRQPSSRPTTPSIEGVSRSWKDVNGRVMEATFQRVSGQQVVFKKPDGKIYQFPLDQLSAGDRALVEAAR